MLFYIVIDFYIFKGIIEKENFCILLLVVKVLYIYN